jgi:AcrR family transcriptional regulator
MISPYISVWSLLLVLSKSSIHICMEKGKLSKLGREDWIRMGTKILIERGIEAVKIDSIAKQLNVTRGSFYWHFKNRDVFLLTILQEWETRRAADVMAQLEALICSPSAKLLKLFDLVAQENTQLEKAIRIWAIKDSRVAALIEQVDRQQLNDLKNLFSQLGFPELEAKSRAQIVYAIRLAWFVIAVPDDSAELAIEVAIVHRLLIQMIPPK